MTSYEDFLKSKRLVVKPSGFEPSGISEKLFPFQKDIVRWACMKGKAAIFAGTGLGKTAMQLQWADQICKHSNGNVLILAPLAVSEQTAREGAKFDVSVTLCKSQSDVLPGINITNYEKLQKFDVSEFVGIVLDECFPPDTPIEVFNTEKLLVSKHIMDIREGDCIFNAFGEDYVKSIYKRRINRAVRISANGYQITCSENHPFFTLHGWRCAQDLQSGDYLVETREAVRLVRSDLSPEISITENTEVLREILFSELEDGATRDESKSPHFGGSREDRESEIKVVSEWISKGVKGIGENCHFESIIESGDAEKDIIETACDEAQTFRAWGKWPEDAIATANNDGCVIRQLDCGISYITGETSSGFSDMLQSGLRQSRATNRDRNRRGEPSIEESIGSEEGFKAGFVRVDGIEILEQGHPELEKYRDADGYVYFYDIKAARHPSYSIEGILVHNSSILKSYDGKTRTAIIEAFRDTPYKLACTATPAPNDHMELCNHAEFLHVMSRPEMLATFFVHDGGQTSQWRLKGHAVKAFWEWVASWAVMMSMPSDLGYEDNGFKLPPVNIEQIVVDRTGYQVKEASGLQDRRRARTDSLELRVAKAVEIVASNPDEIFLVWCDLNKESEALKKAIPGAVEVKGSDDPDYKAKCANEFAMGQIKVMVSKPSIFGYGMNYQVCHNQVFTGLSDSFEQYYQAVRRSWRFGQKEQVNVYVITSEKEGAVVKNIKRKERDFEKMLTGMIGATQEITKKNIKETSREVESYMSDSVFGNGWEMKLGDNVEQIKTVESNSVGYTIFSPPFSSLYTYSNSERDMGNCRTDEEFFDHFGFLAPELFRVLKPGRLMSVHCMNLPTSKQNHGYIGIRDFRGDLIRIFQKAGFIYHSEVCIWKDPVTAMQRTKALGLLWKQLKKDSTMCRQGIPDYLVTFRKPGDNDDRVSHTAEEFPVELWQRYASPIWMDINPSETLQKESARENEDERHIAPLQLEVIRRGLELWTKPGDMVLSPFAGIGSEGFEAVKAGRSFIGMELKKSYYDQAVKNLKRAEFEAKKPPQSTLFKFAQEA